MAFPRGNARSACESLFERPVSTWKRRYGIITAITDYERGIQSPTLTFGVEISTRAVSTWKRPGGSAVNPPPEVVGNIVHGFSTPATAFPRGNEPKRAAKVFGFSGRTIRLKTGTNPIVGNETLWQCCFGSLRVSRGNPGCWVGRHGPKTESFGHLPLSETRPGSAAPPVLSRSRPRPNLTGR
jgi:hypothetical protein